MSHIIEGGFSLGIGMLLESQAEEVWCQDLSWSV